VFPTVPRIIRFMEAASENKRGRGRPRIWHPKIMDMLREVEPSLSDRQRQNHLCMATAIEVLQGWKREGILDVDPLLDDKNRNVSVLVELGRIQDPATFFLAVDWYLRERPKVKDAVAEIRRMRTGKVASGSAFGLHKELVRTVNDYLKRRPDTSMEQVVNALELTLTAVEEAKGEG
jgi:hypothetical protein